MEMFHLRYFVTVAENLSFSKAARQLHMATSPLSQRIRDLEGELHSTLFDRDSRSVHLTSAGAALLPIAQDVLQRFDDIPWRLQQETGTGRRSVYVGIPPGLHPSVREILTRLQQDCSDDYDVKRWPGSSSDLINAVQRGELALAFAHLPVHAERVEVHEVMREPLGAVLPAEEFAGRESVALSELAGYSYVNPASGMLPTYFEQLAVRLSAAGINKRINLHTGDYGSSSEVVANGSAFAISMLDPSSSMHKYRNESIVTIPFEDFDPALTTGLIWRSDRAQEGAELYGLTAQAMHILADPTRGNA